MATILPPPGSSASGAPAIKTVSPAKTIAREASPSAGTASPAGIPLTLRISEALVAGLGPV
jgi:hypothetical protein